MTDYDTHLSDYVLVYRDEDGEEYTQPLADIVEAGTLVSPISDEDMPLVGIMVRHEPYNEDDHRDRIDRDGDIWVLCEDGTWNQYNDGYRDEAIRWGQGIKSVNEIARQWGPLRIKRGGNFTL